jgi:hypothetical protein
MLLSAKAPLLDLGDTNGCPYVRQPTLKERGTREMIKRAILLSLVTAGLSMATTPASFYHECSLLERVARGAESNPATRSVSIELLDRLGEGRIGAVDPGLEEQIGLKRGEIHFDPKFSEIRSCAFRALGSTGTPEAIEYLQNLKPRDLAPDSSQQVWPASQIALREALMKRATNETEKIQILEEAVRSGSLATGWAVQQLCDRGSFLSLPLIEQYFRRSYSQPKQFEQLYGSCRTRIEILSRNPDRAAALGSALSVAYGFNGRDLLGWAITQLADMKSPRAYAELERYKSEIDALPEGSPSKMWANVSSQRIRQVLDARPQGLAVH